MDSELFEKEIKKLMIKYDLLFDFDCDYQHLANTMMFYTRNNAYIANITNPHRYSGCLSDLIGYLTNELEEYFGADIH